MYKNIILVILFITLCVTLYVYFNLASNMQKFQYDRLKYIVNIENEINTKSSKLLEKQICNEKLQYCSSQLNANNNVISEIQHALSTVSN